VLISQLYLPAGPDVPVSVQKVITMFIGQKMPPLSIPEQQDSAVPRPTIDEIARRVLDALPHTAGGIDADLRRNLKAGLSGVLSRMDLVTREEFDAQLRVLHRSREKIEALEQRVGELERHSAIVQTPD
jgi:BMFP domain-containing protein YqiC